MRLLKRNTTRLWCLKVESYEDELDDNGFETGAKVPKYAEPYQVDLSLYPANSEEAQRTFGGASELDMVAQCLDSTFKNDTLLFFDKPTDITKYDYRVEKDAKSINNTMYGLKRRV